jgi:DNA polymerase III alpha subunit
MSISYGEVDKIAKAIPAKMTLKEAVKESPISERFIKLAKKRRS